MPSDSQMNDVYGVTPDLGAGATVGDLRWATVELEGSVRWASARPSAGPFVKDAKSAWLCVPLSLSLQRVFPVGGGDVSPHGRIGLVAQWNREKFETKLGDDVSELTSSQFRPGLVLAGGVGGRAGDGPRWSVEAAFELVPGDRVVESIAHSRKTDDMNLGGFSLRFGLGM